MNNYLDPILRILLTKLLSIENSLELHYSCEYFLPGLQHVHRQPVQEVPAPGIRRCAVQF